MNAIKKARVDKRKLHVPFLSTFNYFRSWPMSRSWGWLGLGRLMYSTCWPETMFWRQRKMNFENIFILPNVIGDRSRRRFGGIFIKIPKVTSARSSLMCMDGRTWDIHGHTVMFIWRTYDVHVARDNLAQNGQNCLQCWILWFWHTLTKYYVWVFHKNNHYFLSVNSIKLIFSPLRETQVLPLNK